MKNLGSTEVSGLKSLILRNIIANFMGQAWSGVLRLISVPLYLHLLGTEAYGLVGLFSSIEAFTLLFDMSLSTTANREIARRSDDRQMNSDSGDLVRTLEVVNWLFGGGAVFVLWLSIDILIEKWVHANALTPATIRYSFFILLGIFLSRMAAPVYRGILNGLQLQVLYNLIVGTSVTLRHLGALSLLYFYSPSILVFLSWQLGIYTLEVLFLSFYAWKNLPENPSIIKSRFRSNILKDVYLFSLQMAGLAILSILLNNVDRLFISRYLNLEQVGYYTVAWILANSMVVLVGPIFNAIFPVFSADYARGDINALTDKFHHYSKRVALVVSPVAAILVFFSKDILILWTGSVEVAEATSGALSLLALGYLFNVLLGITFALQLAAGLAWIPIVVNILSSIISIPALIYVVPLAGIKGAASGHFHPIYLVHQPHHINYMMMNIRNVLLLPP